MKTAEEREEMQTDIEQTYLHSVRLEMEILI